MVFGLPCCCGFAANPAAARKWSEGYIPNVEVLDENGNPLKFYDDVIKGNTVLISFIYTTCLDICPLVTARLAEVYRRLGDAAGREIRFISITIDPETDTAGKNERACAGFSR